MPCSIPRWTGSGARWLASCAFPRGFLPCPCSLPRYRGGSASTSLLSRPAQASHALRPAQLLTHHTWALSRGSALADYSARKLPSSTNNLLGWVLPPLVICAVEAHPVTPYSQAQTSRLTNRQLGCFRVLKPAENLVESCTASPPLRTSWSRRCVTTIASCIRRQPA